ncbi:hypothetical protein [Haloarchaeobius baliensis]|uniref:hypothetical protein n=1 Tax=Haloarchaeobius baliensis TaxID=1670458 RepID=UPI003F88433B
MSVTGPADGRSDAADGTESTFLDRIEFLTGRDPDLGSFLLVVGIVTCVFIALFQLALPAPVSYLLTAGVVFVTVLSAIIGVVLDSLGYFERRTAPAVEAEPRETTRRPWVPVGKPAAPLPPLLNFDAELRAYADLFDGELPSAFDPFISDYRRLKTNTRNRATIASDLRADLNPIGALFAIGTEGDRIYEDISERLFRYISERGDAVTVERLVFHDGDGTETDLASLANQLAHVELTIANEGEAAAVEVVVEFYDEQDEPVSSSAWNVGLLRPGATKVFDTDVFVPAAARRASTRLGISDPRRAVASA